ncbi:MAG: hypothetical protein WBM14_09330 [Terracidiphilus sp.]
MAIVVKSSGAMRLGPVARNLINPDAWTGGYPGPPAYVRELDALLHFAKQNNCLERFLPNLEAQDRQRDKCLNELRLAYFFKSLGYGISAWDPPGANGKTGEFMLNWTEESSVFVEIKSRGWESQLSSSQLDAGCARLSKYEVWKGGAVGNWKPVQRCISSEKTYPKFLPTRPNLLIISDDLNVSLHDSLCHVEAALFGEKRFYGEDGYFTTNRFENIGGLGVFNSFSRASSRGIEYEFIVYANPNALPATRLSSSWTVYTEKFCCIVRGTDPRQGIMYL